MVSFDLLLFISQERGGRVKSERRERAGKDDEGDGHLWDHETMDACPPLVIPTVSEHLFHVRKIYIYK